MATRTTTAQTIADKAYHRFLARGGEHGRDLEDWFAAEAEVKTARPKRVTVKPRTAARPKNAKA